MTSPGEAPDPGERPVYRNEGIRTLLETFTLGAPAQVLQLKVILADLRDSGFGVFLFVAILPAFIPIPGFGGAISGPLVVLIGLQMLIGLRRPWLPGFIGNRGPRRSTMTRFIGKISPMLRWLDRMLKPRWKPLLDWPPAHAFSGLLLVLLGILLSLPIPLTNYLFGALLLLYALALLERDGRLMALCWTGGVACVAVFGLASGQLVDLCRDLVARFAG